MKLQTIIVPLFAAAALASGCAGTEARYGSNNHRNGAAHSNENYYAAIDSIEAASDGNDGNAIAGIAVGGAIVGHEIGKANVGQDVYFIRIRFDDRSYQTVTQTGLDGLRVGDSVRIEHDRVRRY